MHLLILSMVLSAPPQVSPAPTVSKVKVMGYSDVSCSVPQCSGPAQVAVKTMGTKASSTTVKGAKECPCSAQCTCGCVETGVCNCESGVVRSIPVQTFPQYQPQVQYQTFQPQMMSNFQPFMNAPQSSYISQGAFSGGRFGGFSGGRSFGGGCGPGG